MPTPIVDSTTTYSRTYGTHSHTVWVSYKNTVVNDSTQQVIIAMHGGRAGEYETHRARWMDIVAPVYTAEDFIFVYPETHKHSYVGSQLDLQELTDAINDLAAINVSGIGVITSSAGNRSSLTYCQENPNDWAAFVSSNGNVILEEPWTHINQADISGMNTPIFLLAGDERRRDVVSQEALNGAIEHWNPTLEHAHTEYTGSDHSMLFLDGTVGDKDPNYDQIHTDIKAFFNWALKGEAKPSFVTP